MSLAEMLFDSAAKLLTVTCGERLRRKNETGSVEKDELERDTEEEEIRRGAAEQVEKWLFELRGDLEEKKAERKTKEKEVWKTGGGWIWLQRQTLPIKEERMLGE